MQAGISLGNNGAEGKGKRNEQGVTKINGDDPAFSQAAGKQSVLLVG